MLGEVQGVAVGMEIQVVVHVVRFGPVREANEAFGWLGVFHEATSSRRRVMKSAMGMGPRFSLERVRTATADASASLSPTTSM